MIEILHFVQNDREKFRVTGRIPDDWTVLTTGEARWQGLLQISIFYDLGASCNEVAEVFSVQHTVGKQGKVCDLLQYLIITRKSLKIRL